MRRTFGLLVLVPATLAASALVANASASRPLTLGDRVKAQRAIEQVYWRHRIWPKDNPEPKPSLDTVMPESAIQAKVEDYLKKSNALDAWWRRPITGEQLQAELDRMARGSRDPRLLQELFDALGDDPALIAETLVRPILAERLARNWYEGDSSKASFDAWWKLERVKESTEIVTSSRAFVLPVLDPVGCTNDTWTPTLTEVPDRRALHTAVWTGAEMIVWGGSADGYQLNTGGRYNPATDTWTPTSTGVGLPLAADRHTAVWTGTEMIVWGGQHIDSITGSFSFLDSGARYNPTNDSWTPTSKGANLPTGRHSHLAIWTGSEMIIWGGLGSGGRSGGRYNPITDGWTTISTGANAPFGSSSSAAVWTGTSMIIWGGTFPSEGGRYDPVADSWAPILTGANVPSPRSSPTAVWTGTEMILWGGYDSGNQVLFNTGGRYNPTTNSWIPTSTGANVPSPRDGHMAIWTGAKMIVWGGQGAGYFNDGAAYDPANDSWVPLASTTLQPRAQHSAVWTGTEMIVWGGSVSSGSSLYTVNTGGRYNPTTNAWVSTASLATAPTGRHSHTAVWTGTEMIVWGGQAAGPAPNGSAMLNSGGRYTPATDSWLPTSVGSGVPSGRLEHSAVWTGTEMIVWGGGDFAGWRNTGGRYNPVTDSWSATSTGLNVPAMLQVHHSVWTGHEMIVWGIGIFGDDSTLTGGRYDPATNSWRTMAAGTTAPDEFGGPYAWTGHEMIVWKGGPATGSRYDPSTDSWATISTSPNAPAYHPGFVNVWTGSEMVVWGGGLTKSGGRYNPLTDNWIPTSTGANVPSDRVGAKGVWTGSELLLWGGYYDGIHPATVGGRYDPTTNSWLPMSIRPDAPYPVSIRHTAVWTGTEMIVWGGEPGGLTGGRYCACPSGRLVYRDADGDGYGDPGDSSPSCDGLAPAGYVLDYADCNDASATAHPGAAETCNALDDDCDGLVDDSVSGVDSDADAIHDACDNCPFVVNTAQSDSDHDGQGDACDLNDGLILEWRYDKSSVSWQAEQGPTSWNVYIGDLDVLKATGEYTQLPGSNALADRSCGELATVADEFGVPAPGKASFSLITGVTGGVEGSLGSSSSGPRPNANPCP